MLSELAQILQVVGIQENLRPEHPLELRLEKARLHSARELVVTEEGRVLLARGRLALLPQRGDRRVLESLCHLRVRGLGRLEFAARRGCRRDDGLNRLLDLRDVQRFRVGGRQLAFELRHQRRVHIVQIALVLDANLFERGCELGSVSGFDFVVEPLANGLGRHISKQYLREDTPGLSGRRCAAEQIGL